MILLGDVPVTPDADQARGWLADELTKPIYHSGSQSLLQRFIAWVNQLLSSLLNAAGRPSTAIVVVVLIVAIIIAAIVLAGPIARSRRVYQPEPAALDEHDLRSAEEMRAASAAARRGGDYALAVLEAFRAIARGLEERAILDERPGRTAREVAIEASPALPQLANRLAEGATVFEASYYGRRAVGRAQADAMADLESAVRAARPARVLTEAAG